MIRDAREKLLTLVNRATSPTEEGDNEARTAAVEACKLLVKHPELVASQVVRAHIVTGQVVTGRVVTPQPVTVTPIHPDAERLREWRAMLKRKSLREGHALTSTLCADCGKPIAEGEPVVEMESDELATHLACAAWWWKYQPPQHASDAGMDLAS